MSQEEQARLETLNRVRQKHLSVEEAACVLGGSERHAERLLVGYRKEGAAALVHGKRGRRPANTTPEEKRKRLITLARTAYAG